MRETSNIRMGSMGDEVERPNKTVIVFVLRPKRNMRYQYSYLIATPRPCVGTGCTISSSGLTYRAYNI